MISRHRDYTRNENYIQSLMNVDEIKTIANKMQKYAKIVTNYDWAGFYIGNVWWIQCHKNDLIHYINRLEKN